VQFFCVTQREKSAVMKPLRSRAVEQSTFSSPLRMARRRRMALSPPKELVCRVDSKQFKIKKGFRLIAGNLFCLQR